MEKYIQLKLIGITYNQIESGVYALILEDPVSKKRLPIVIGYLEAQSIECKLQEVKTPRPLTHDVMARLISSLNATLDRIVIHQLPTGVFAANIHLTDEIGRKLLIDSRSSDAIALAIRMDAPIFARYDLLEKAGYDADKAPRPRRTVRTVIRGGMQETKKTEKKPDADNDYASFSEAELQKELLRFVGEEKYEEAAKVKAEIERRQKDKDK